MFSQTRHPRSVSPVSEALISAGQAVLLVAIAALPVFVSAHTGDHPHVHAEQMAPASVLSLIGGTALAAGASVALGLKSRAAAPHWLRSGALVLAVAGLIALAAGLA